MHQLITRICNRLNRLLYQQTILILTLLFCAGVLGALWSISRLSSNLIEAQAIENATEYAQAITTSRDLYSSETVDRAKVVHGITVTHDYLNQEGAIPIPATYLMKLGEQISEKNTGMFVRLYSDYPFPWRQSEGGAKDDFEQKALLYLRKNPQQLFTRFEKFQGVPSLRYAQADILKPSCVNCHNIHPDSPKTDWKVGDVRGVLEISISLETFIAKTRSGMRETFLMLAGISVLALSGLTLVIGRLRRTSQELERRVIERTEQLQKTNEELAREQNQSERLLLNILPKAIAQQLKEGQNNIADKFTDVTILFADIVGFTKLSQTISPIELVNLLNQIFSAFDRLSEQHNLEKIKTIGDAYMVASGLPHPQKYHAQAIAEMALDMQREIEKLNTQKNLKLSIRVGINTGPVVAGVIGKKKFNYDLWGDAVNTASRMESHGIPGMIQVTESTYSCLQDQYHFQKRGLIKVKGKGEMITYFLISRLEKISVKNMI